MSVDGELLGTAVLELTTDGRGLARGLAAGKATAERETAAMQASVSRRMTAMGASMEKAGATMTRRVTVPIVGLGAAAIKMAADFDSAMERVHTQSGASQREVDQLRGKVLALSKAMGQSPTDLANALYRIEGAGYRGAKAYDALHAAAELAAIGNANVEDTAKTLTQAMKPGIKGVSGFHDAVAQVNATVGAGDMRLQQLVDALGTGVVTSAKMAGLSFQDVTGALAVFGDETNNVSGWAAQLATALHFIESPTAKASKALAAMGMTDSQLAEDMHKPRGLLAALNDLKTHLSELPGGEHGVQAGQMLSAIFPGGRGRVLQVLLNQVDLYEQKMNQIQATGDRTGEAFARTQQTQAFKIHQAWSTIEADLVEVGHKIAPEVVGLGADAANAIDKVATAFTRLPKPVQDAILGGTLTLAAAGPILGLAGGAVRTAGRLGKLATGDLRGALAKTSLGGSVGTMEVDTLIVKTMVGGGGLSAGGGAAGTAERDAEKTAAGKGFLDTLRQDGLKRVLAAGGRAAATEAVPVVVTGGAITLGIAGLTKGVTSLFGQGVAPTAKEGHHDDAQGLRDLAAAATPAQVKLNQVDAVLGRLKADLAAHPYSGGYLRAQIADEEQARQSILRYAQTHHEKLLEVSGDTKTGMGVVGRAFSEGAVTVQTAMALISGDTDRGAGKIKRDFQDAIGAVRRAMSDGTISMKAGRQEIARLQRQIHDLRTGTDKDAPKTGQDLAGIGGSAAGAALAVAGSAKEIATDVNSLAKSLKAKGITFTPAKSMAGKLTALNVLGPLPDYSGLTGLGHAGGGFIGQHGEAGRDTVPIVVGRGEAILNRHQQAVVEGHLGPGFLDRLFAGVRTPHYMAAGGRAGLPNVTVMGPPGGLLRVAQGAAHYMDRAASQYLGRIAPKGGGMDFSGVKGVGGDAAANMALGRRMMLAAGWPASQWPFLQKLWMQESGWSANAVNKSSGAYGIPQALGHGNVYALGDARAQIAWGLNYIRGRYGSPAAAWAHEVAHDWYALGGRVPRFAAGGRVGARTKPKPGLPTKSKPAKRGKHPATHRPSVTSVLTLDMAGFPHKGYNLIGTLLGDGPTSIAAMVEREANQSTVFDRTQETFVVTPADGSAPYIDQGAVNQRVGELTTLLGMENPLLATVQDAAKRTKQVHDQIARAKAAAVRRRDAIRKRALVLLKRIRDLQKKIANARKAQALERTKRHPNQTLIKGYQRRIIDWTSQLGPLQRDLQKLTGDSTRIGTGGVLGQENVQVDQANQALTDTDDWRKSLTGLSGMGGTQFDVQGVLYDLRSQLGQLSPDALAQALQQAKGTGSTSASDTTQQLNDLLKQQLTQTQQLLAVSQAQYQVFAGIGDLPPFGGSFLNGGPVPGPLGAARTAIVHGGEYVLDADARQNIGAALGALHREVAQLRSEAGGVRYALSSLASVSGEDAVLRRAIGKAAAQAIGDTAYSRGQVPTGRLP